MPITPDNFALKLEAAMRANKQSKLYSPDMADKLYRLTERMLEVNEHMNLTAITDLDGVILKHYVDSFTVSKHIPEGAAIIDVGCGAGFPTLPLAIARPDLHITALDSTAKRVRYIEETANLLNIPNISCLVGRAEELAQDKDHREAYDIACARAVARLNVLTELCMGFVKVNGTFVAMKANFKEELDEAKNAIKIMGGKLDYVEDFSLVTPDSTEGDPRGIISIAKISETPKNYPRNNSQIKKKPL